MTILEILPVLDKTVLYLIYGAIVVHFFEQKNLMEKLKYALIVLGIFGIVFLVEKQLIDFLFAPQWIFIFTQMLIMTWLSFTGVEIFLDKTLVFILFMVFVFSISLNSFFSFLIGISAYVIVSFDVIYSAAKIVLGKLASYK